ncbi:MAG: M48 family metallopeptidase [Spirochaetia bacterium]
MSGRRSVVREILIILAAAAILALAAFVGQRLLFPRPAVSPDFASELDESLGSLMRNQIRATQKVIDTPAVSKAFAVIADRLHDALPEPRIRFEVIVLQSPEINAFTLPGDAVCVDTGLIRELHSADEMAGVLGHELSHAVNRDPLTLLARRVGIAALISAVSGGQGGRILSRTAQTLVDMHYGREAEDRADAFSVGLLARAGIPPDSFGNALERIRDSDPKEPGLLKYLDPHSPIDQRISHARDLARRQAMAPLRPLGVDWGALIEALPER